MDERVSVGGPLRSGFARTQSTHIWKHFQCSKGVQGEPGNIFKHSTKCLGVVSQTVICTGIAPTSADEGFHTLLCGSAVASGQSFHLTAVFSCNQLLRTPSRPDQASSKAKVSEQFTIPFDYTRGAPKNYLLELSSVGWAPCNTGFPS